mgnify:CR=1 FL=1
MVGLTCYFHSCSNNLLAQTNFTSNCLESCGKKILSSSHHYYMNLMVDQSLGNLREKKNLICSSVWLGELCQYKDESAKLVDNLDPFNDN